MEPTPSTKASSDKQSSGAPRALPAVLGCVVFGLLLAAIVWLQTKPVLEIPDMGTLDCRESWKAGTWAMRAALGMTAVAVVFRWWSVALLGTSGAVLAFGMILARAFGKVTKLLDNPDLDPMMREMIQKMLDGTRLLPAFYAICILLVVLFLGLFRAWWRARKARHD